MDKKKSNDIIEEILVSLNRSFSFAFHRCTSLVTQSEIGEFGRPREESDDDQTRHNVNTHSVALRVVSYISNERAHSNNDDTFGDHEYSKGTWKFLQGATFGNAEVQVDQSSAT